MQALFLSPQDGPRPRWLHAFPHLQQFESADELLKCQTSDAVVWVNLEALPDIGADDAIGLLVDVGCKVVALSAYPRETQAFALLAKGVRGYCHVEAAPEQLLEVAQVVADGALWLSPELVQRLVTAGLRLDTTKAPTPTAHLEVFTPREEQVAVMVGRGFNNREIAASLDVTERTVKANLTTIFEKLGLRDRVQLALYVNRLPIH